MREAGLGIEDVDALEVEGDVQFLAHPDVELRGRARHDLLVSG
jgi:hypothetical protein